MEPSGLQSRDSFRPLDQICTCSFDESVTRPSQVVSSFVVSPGTLYQDHRENTLLPLRGLKQIAEKSHVSCQVEPRVCD
jgi:hypothetical protein